MDPLIGAIDEGTSSARFILFRAGTTEIVASHQETLSQICPQEGWVEQDPKEILTVVNNCIEKTVEKLIALGGHAKDIVAIGVTNQRESTLVWEKSTGNPLYNSIVWLDTRTSTTLDQLLEKIPNKTKNKNYLKPLCGLPLSPYFSACKIRWLYDNVPKIKKAIAENNCLFGTVDSWIIWNLTGGPNGGLHITDVTNASRTMLMNIDSLKWDPVLLNFFGVTQNVLPKIKSSSEVYGNVQIGSLKGIPIAGCVGDQQSALLGQQCMIFFFLRQKQLMVPVVFFYTIQLGSKTPPIYALEGSVAIAGAALTWLKNNLNVLESIGDAQKIGEKAELQESGEVYFVPAFSGLFAPYWQQEARGVIIGISEDTQDCHLVRAALDAVCYQTRDILEAMNKDARSHLTTIQVDGGMTANSLLMQLQADIAGVTVKKAAMAESTALGAAMLAGAAIGHWDLTRFMELSSESWTPKLSEDERDVRYSKWKFAVEKSMGWNVL